MSGFVVGGGKLDAEGFLKFLLMTFRPGYATGLNVTQRGAGANMSVDVNVNSSGFAGAMLNTSANVPYFGWIAATENVAVAASDPSNPRIDVTVAYVNLLAISTSITDNTGAFLFKTVAGTPAGSPSAPSAATIQASVGAGNPYVLLPNGKIAVAASVSSIVTANLSDPGSTPMAMQTGYLWGGATNTKGHQVPNVADGYTAITSRSDSKIGFTELLSTIFSSQVTTYTNPGTAGGTFYYINLGGIKLFFGKTASMTVVGSGNQSVTAGVTYPASFFTTIQLISPSVDIVTATQYLTVNLNSRSDPNSVSLGLQQTNGTNGSAPIDLLVVGT